MSSKNGWLWAVGISSAMGPQAMMGAEKTTPEAEAETPATPEPETEPAPPATPAPAIEPETPAAPAGQVEYHGNVKSLAFHQPGCRYYDGTDCTAVLTSRDQALAEGYKPCKVCKP